MDTKKIKLERVLPVVSAILLTVIFIFITFSDRPFWTRGEAREALVVAAMFEQKNLVLPLRNWTDIPSKPPLFHWIAYVASICIGEMNEFTIRFPSALTAFSSLFVLFAFIRRKFSVDFALLVTVVCATAFEFFRSATHARVDMVFSFCLLIAFIALFKLMNSSKPSFLLLIITSISLALAILGKGPAAIIVPGFACALYLYFTVDKTILREAFVKFSYLALVFLFAFLLSSIWYYLAYLQAGSDFIMKQLFGENLARVVQVQGVYKGHYKPFYFSFVDFLIGFMPWSLFLPPALYLLWKNRYSIKQADNRVLLFSCIWIFSFLLAITLSSSKREVYFLPTYPQSALLLVWAFAQATQNDKKTIALKVYSSISASLLYVLSIGLLGVIVAAYVPSFDFYFFQRFKLDESIAKLLVEFIAHNVGLFIVFAFSFAAAYLLQKQKFVDSIVYLVTSLVILGGLLVPFISLFAEIGSPKEFMSEVKSQVSSNEPLFQFVHNFYPAVYYAFRPIKGMNDANSLIGLNYAYILVRKSDKDLFEKLVPYTKLVIESSNLAANNEDKLLLMKYEKP